MSARSRVYWLTEPCRIRRKDQSIRIERVDGTPVDIPVTDISDLVAFASVDVNTSVVSLLARYGITVHLLDHYGNYAGAVTPAQTQVSGTAVLRQAAAASDPATRMRIARECVLSSGHNTRWAHSDDMLDSAWAELKRGVTEATSTEQLMAAEGNFHRTAWAALDTRLPDWLRLSGRSRRPPRNAGNAFISFTNGIIYARRVTAIRCTPLHPGIAFLHSTQERVRNSLALDLAEPFKPLFATRLLLRLASRHQLDKGDFETGINQASLSATGRKKIIAVVRDELAQTIQHRGLGRPVTYDQLIHLEALKLLRTCIESTPYKAFRAWW